MLDLHDMKIAILITHGVEEAQFIESRRALVEAGACVEVVSPMPEIQAFNANVPLDRVLPTRALENVRAIDYDAVLLPGGPLDAEHLSHDPQAIVFVQEMQSAGKPVAALCHAPLILLSAGLLRGRKITSIPSIEREIRNAGGEWLDQAVVIDSNWVTGRNPDDLTAFINEMLLFFARSTPSVIQVAESA